MLTLSLYLLAEISGYVGLLYRRRDMEMLFLYLSPASLFRSCQFEPNLQKFFRHKNYLLV